MRLLLSIAVCLLVTACGGSQSGATDSLDAALSAYEHNDPVRAQKEADALLADSAAFSALDAPQLCRLSLLLVRLNNDTPDGEANDASVARCLTRARTLQPDSVNDFLRSLRGEDAGRLMVLDRVGSYMEIPRDSLVSAEDTVPTDSLMH